MRPTNDGDGGLQRQGDGRSQGDAVEGNIKNYSCFNIGPDGDKFYEFAKLKEDYLPLRSPKKDIYAAGN